MNDRIFGSISFLLSLFYIYSAFIIEESFIQDPVGPKIFPYIIAFFLLTSSLFLIFKPDPKPEWAEFGKIIEVLVTAIVLILYAIILPIIGFVITTFLASSFISWRLGATIKSAFLVSAAISISIFVLFRYVLGLSLATGPLGF
ncbi:MAG: tripartite tricarboxylate transporter TctB family protein [Pelagibacteraceae bacterium]